MSGKLFCQSSLLLNIPCAKSVIEVMNGGTADNKVRKTMLEQPNYTAEDFNVHLCLRKNQQSTENDRKSNK